MRGYGGEIFESEPTLQAREETLAKVIAKASVIVKYKKETISGHSKYLKRSLKS
ncbi:MAG: hypothetical protein ACKO13_15325 [Cytophagales bacterium]